MEQAIIDHFLNHWTAYIALFWVAEKVVKLTPTKYDDIFFDIFIGGIKKLVGKGGK